MSGLNWIYPPPRRRSEGRRRSVLTDLRMDEWCTKTHGESGLTKACIDSPHTLEHVSEEVLNYLKKYVPERGAGLLAGSSVHADMR